MIRFVDCNAAIGQPNCPSGWRAYSPEAVQKAAETAGIEHVFAFHNSGLDLHPIHGNEAMDFVAKNNPFYSSVWLIMPNATGEFFDASELRQKMDENNIDMVRVCPRYNSLSYSLSDWCMGEQFSMLEQRGTPVLLDQDQTDWETVHQLCEAHPDLKLIITNCYYRHSRYVMALMKTHKNLYIETSGMKSFGVLQTYCEKLGADRMVFGSNLGTFSAGSAVALVNYALISEKEKEQIAHGTLETLIERQVL